MGKNLLPILFLVLAAASYPADHRVIVDPNGSGRGCVVVHDITTLFCETPITSKGWNSIWGLDTTITKPDSAK